MLKNKEIRAAKEFLRKRGVKGVSAKDFAEASEESGQSFSELLKSMSVIAKSLTNA